MISNTLFGFDENVILSNVDAILSGNYKNGTIPKFWDGKASTRIAEVLSS